MSFLRIQIGKLVCCAGYISSAETIAISAPAGAEIAKYVLGLIGAEFHYFCHLVQKYLIGKNVYLTTATPRKVPRSSDNHDNAVLQCTLTSRYHNEERELMSGPKLGNVGPPQNHLSGPPKIFFLGW